MAGVDVAAVTGIAAVAGGGVIARIVAAMIVDMLLPDVDVGIPPKQAAAAASMPRLITENETLVFMTMQTDEEV